MRCRVFADPVRFTAPSLSPVSPGLGEIDTANPFPSYNSAISISTWIGAPLQGLVLPFRIKASTPPLIERLTSRMRPMALRSPPPALLE